MGGTILSLGCSLPRCIGYQDVYVDERAWSSSWTPSTWRTWETPRSWPRTDQRLLRKFRINIERVFSGEAKDSSLLPRGWQRAEEED